MSNIIRRKTTALSLTVALTRICLDGALWWPPARSPVKAGLLLVHGYAGNFYTGWPRLAEALARQGYLTLALNMRDHDLTPETLFADNRLDIEAGVKLLAGGGRRRSSSWARAWGQTASSFTRRRQPTPGFAA